MRKVDAERKITNLISRLDTSTGMLLAASAKDNLIKHAMEKVSGVSFELGQIIDEL
jgi:hypothetical protein